MSQIENKLNIEKLLGNLSKNDLVGANGISSKGLVTLVENIIHEIMNKEKSEYLDSAQNDKSNGSYERKLNTTVGKLNLNVPRVRSGEFRSSLLPEKYQRYDESFEELIFSFLINGDSKKEIVHKMKYRGISFSEKAYDEIFNFIKEQMEDFKCKELDSEYNFIYIDAYHCMIKDKQVKKGVIYTVLGVDKFANKSIVGFYPFFGRENKSTWMEVFQNLINRGLKRVLMFISDDFSGMSEAINTLFPLSDIQKCIVHLDRNLYRNMQKEDAKKVTKKLYEIRTTCDTYEAALTLYESDVIEKFKKQYPSFIKHLEKRKTEHLCFMKYPDATRKHIYTTNPVESVHSSFEKMRIKKGGFFKSMDILNGAIFIVSDKLNLTWKKPIPMIKSKIYELNQMFNIKFYEEDF
ncbi:MAG: IS256 family transposase [Flavobacteriales bacterium]|nr:IS256 family transposase [Flavobacteriales bacterium]